MSLFLSTKCSILRNFLIAGKMFFRIVNHLSKKILCSLPFNSFLLFTMLLDLRKFFFIKLTHFLPMSMRAFEIDYELIFILLKKTICLRLFQYYTSQLMIT